VGNLREFEYTREKLLAGGGFPIRRSSEYGSLIIHSMETGTPRSVYGNVANEGLIDNLPAGACVEVRCEVDRRGLRPVPFGCLPPQLAALNRSNINVQELVVRAALERNLEHVYHAAYVDPHAAAVLTLGEIRAMVNELVEAHGVRSVMRDA
jgi:alpha-galactosidase